MPECWVDTAGLHMAVSFKGKAFSRQFERHCRLNGLIIQTVDRRCIVRGTHTDKLLPVYGQLAPEEIERGLSLLNICIESCED